MSDFKVGRAEFSPYLAHQDPVTAWSNRAVLLQKEVDRLNAEKERLRDGIRALAAKHENADAWTPHKVIRHREVAEECRALLREDGE